MQGPYTYAYGMKYIGFCERLIITPLTDKYFLSISTAMNNASIPCVTSHHSNDGYSGKRAMITGLASELGVDHYHLECSRMTSPQSFFDVIHAQISAGGLWLTFNHVESFLPPMLSICLTVLSSLSDALHCRSTYFMLAGQRIDFIHPNSHNPSNMIPSTQPRTVLLYGTSHNSINEPFSLPVSARQQFRPIIYIPPSFSILVETFLTVYNFQSIPMLSSRLITLSDYIINYNIAPAPLVYSLLFRCIKDIGARHNYNNYQGINNNNNTSTTTTTTTTGGIGIGSGRSFVVNNSSKISNNNSSSSSNTPIIELLVKGFFTSLPVSIQQLISDQHFRFISNLCLDTLFIRDNDLKDFQQIMPTDYFACMDYLCNSLRQTQYNCILVTGATNIGRWYLHYHHHHHHHYRHHILIIIIVTFIIITPSASLSSLSSTSPSSFECR